MSDSSSIWQWASNALRKCFWPITTANDLGADGIKDLLTTAVESTDDALVQSVTNLAIQIIDFVNGTDAGQVNSKTDLMAAAKKVIDAWNTFVGSPGASQDLITKLVEYLLLRLLWSAGAAAHSALALSGIVDESMRAGQRLTLKNVEYLWRPRDLLAQVYGWGTPAFKADLLLRRLSNLAASLMAPVSIVSASDNYHDLDPNVDTTSQPPPGVLVASLLNSSANGAVVRAGFVAMPFPGATVTDGGIAVMPYGVASFPESNLSPDWTILFKARIDEDYGLILRPSGLKIAKLNPNAKSGSIEAVLARSSPWLLPLGGEFSLSADQLELSITASLGEFFAAELKVKGFAVTVKAPDNDGFLAQILPRGGLAAKGDLSIGWSPDAGLHFSGGAGFKTSNALHVTIGPVTLTRLALSAEISDKPILHAEGAIDILAQLGPIKTTIRGLGVRSEFDLVRPGDPTEGTLGPVRFDLGFKFPDGVGLAIDAGAVAGGGFIGFNQAKGQYSGVFALSVVDLFQVEIIGVLDTRLPDGSKGFSFLLIITFDFAPIQLGFGFTLNGVGGLGSVNRAMSQDALQQGFRANTLNSVLFPPDPVKNSAQIISNISNFFPAANGRYVFGPMLKIDWGTPKPLVQFSAGVILEVPEPIRLVILGLIDAGFPTIEKALVELHMDILGQILFDQKRLSVDGHLYHSRVLSFPVGGSLTLRLAWGEPPNFLFALGGVNPNFSTAGLDLGTMSRLSISIGYGDNPRIIANSYFALTSNTLQFGANIEASASAGGFKVHGYLGFDVLVVFSPFSFEFDFTSSFDVSFNGTSLASLSVDGLLSYGKVLPGDNSPKPWHLHAHATIHILVFSAGADINLTWGDNTNNQNAMLAVPVLPGLKEALTSPRSWSAALPEGTAPLVTLFSSKAADQVVRVHPMGTLSVHENVVPLGLTIAKFGNAPPADGNYFEIQGATGGDGAALTVEGPNTAYFAPAQFLNLSDADKLSAPSFEPYDAGVKFDSTGIAVGATSPRAVGYREQYIDQICSPSRPAGRLYLMPANLQVHFIRQGAAFASPLKNTGLGKYQNGPTTPAVTMHEPSHVVVGVDDLGIRSDISSADGTTYFKAREALNSYLTSHPQDKGKLQIMPLHEVPR